jgi:hypothetical protein
MREKTDIIKTMKRFNTIIFILIFISVMSTGKINAQASPPVTATGQIFAEIIPVFTASETSQLNFGRFSPGPEGGEIILSPQSTAAILGSIYKGSGSVNAASFYVTGETDAAYSISLPSSPVVLKSISSSKSMEIYNWISTPESGIASGNLHNGFQVVYIGATLKVGTIDENPVGIYTGTYSVTFEFN